MRAFYSYAGKSAHVLLLNAQGGRVRWSRAAVAVAVAAAAVAVAAAAVARPSPPPGQKPCPFPGPSFVALTNAPNQSPSDKITQR